MLATDTNGDGLVKYAVSGNSGSWPPQIKYRPANWWDTIGFGHEDAYANAGGIARCGYANPGATIRPGG